MAGPIVLPAPSPAAEVCLGAVGAVVKNHGPGTVFYSGSQDVGSAPQGMIPQGSTATLFGTQFLFVAIRATITMESRDADPGDAGSVVSRISGSIAVIAHGATTAAPRQYASGVPVSANSVAIWVGSVVPANGIDGDLRIQTS